MVQIPVPLTYKLMILIVISSLFPHVKKVIILNIDEFL